MASLMDFIKQFTVGTGGSLEENLGKNIAGQVRTEVIPAVWFELLRLIPEKQFMRWLGNRQKIIKVAAPIVAVVLKQFTKLSPGGDDVLAEIIKEFTQQVEKVALEYKVEDKDEEEHAKKVTSQTQLMITIIKGFARGKKKTPVSPVDLFTKFNAKAEKMDEEQREQLLSVIAALEPFEVAELFTLDDVERDKLFAFFTVPKPPVVPKKKKPKVNPTLKKIDDFFGDDRFLGKAINKIFG